MRCQGKMVSQTVRWGTLCFTVHFSVIPSPVARKESAGGAGWVIFLTHWEREPRVMFIPVPCQLHFPLHSTRKTQNCLFPCLFLQCKLFHLPSTPRNLAREKSTPSKRSAKANCTQNTRKLWEPADSSELANPLPGLTHKGRVNLRPTGGVSQPHASISATKLLERQTNHVPCQHFT